MAEGTNTSADCDDATQQDAGLGVSAVRRIGRGAVCFYTPPVHIAPAPGVKVMACELYADRYVGTKADLIASGLLPDGLFPGDPGMRKATVTLLPVGAQSDGCDQPGRMFICKKPGGRFAITLTVSEEEQARRERVSHHREAQACLGLLFEALRRSREALDIDVVANALKVEAPEALMYLGARSYPRPSPSFEAGAAPARQDGAHLRLVHSAPTSQRTC